VLEVPDGQPELAEVVI